MACLLTEDSTALKRWLYTMALPLPPFCSHGLYTVRGTVPQSIFPLFCIDEDLAKMPKMRASLFGHNNETTVPAYCVTYKACW